MKTKQLSFDDLVEKPISPRNVAGRLADDDPAWDERYETAQLAADDAAETSDTSIADWLRTFGPGSSYYAGGTVAMRPKLLDLFCGAGGAAMGYHRAGFDVVGVDIAPQPRYPFAFAQADALEYAMRHGHEFDAIHASPECKGYSVVTNCRPGVSHHKGIPEVRELLERIGKPYVIENVPGAIRDLKPNLMLCGLMFGLTMFRHRYFATSFMALAPPHPSHKGHRIGRDGFVCMCGHGDANHNSTPPDHRTVGAWRAASGIDWMIRAEMSQAIPPVYTAHIGRQLIQFVGVRHAD